MQFFGVFRIRCSESECKFLVNSKPCDYKMNSKNMCTLIFLDFRTWRSSFNICAISMHFLRMFSRSSQTSKNKLRWPTNIDVAVLSTDEEAQYCMIHVSCLVGLKIQTLETDESTLKQPQHSQANAKAICLFSPRRDYSQHGSVPRAALVPTTTAEWISVSRLTDAMDLLEIPDELENR